MTPRPPFAWLRTPRRALACGWRKLAASQRGRLYQSPEWEVDGGVERERPRRVRRGRAPQWMLAAVFSLASGPGCINPAVTGSRAGAGLIIERITAVPGGRANGSPAGYLQSDVCVRDEARGPCQVFDDIGQVTTRLHFKDPGTVDNPSSPTTANFVTLKRYRVRYVRSDGRDRPGIDVPHPWEGAMTATTMAESQTAAFTLVRASAKLEAPLRALIDGGGAVILNAAAEIDFYGHDQTGAGVAATGRIGVHFADWAN